MRIRPVRVVHRALVLLIVPFAVCAGLAIPAFLIAMWVALVTWFSANLYGYDVPAWTDINRWPPTALAYLVEHLRQIAVGMLIAFLVTLAVSLLIEVRQRHTAADSPTP